MGLGEICEAGLESFSNRLTVNPWTQIEPATTRTVSMTTPRTTDRKVIRTTLGLGLRSRNEGSALHACGDLGTMLDSPKINQQHTKL